MMQITRSHEHYHHKEDWLVTYWHFSFDRYYDAKKMSFGPLRVFNDDTISPGKGFGFHPHRDMEIITYVTEGELEHRDDQGNSGIVRAGEVQRMTAGSGIIHSEYNHSKDRLVKLLQMWIFADKRGLKPSWEQQKFEKQDSEGKLLPVVVPEGVHDGKALHINQDARICISSLSTGSRVSHVIMPRRKVYLFVIGGQIRVGTDMLDTKDAAKIENESNLEILTSKPSELILLDLPEEFRVNH